MKLLNSLLESRRYLRFKSTILLAVLMIFSIEGYCQIHVGPHNNVGVRIEQDSTVTLKIDNSIDENDLNMINISSKCHLDTFAYSTYRNLHLNTEFDISNVGGSKRFYALDNVVDHIQFGPNESRFGINNMAREILDFDLSNLSTFVVGINNHGLWYSDAYHIGIWNQNYQNEGDGPRYGIYNSLSSTEEGEAFVQGPQIGIYNQLNSVPGVTIPMALYSGINNPNYYAGYFNGDVTIVGDFVVLPSDSTIKENLVPSPYGLSEILQLNTVKFEYKNDLGHNLPDGAHLGLIAQELDDVVPMLVDQTIFSIPDSRTESYDSEGNSVGLVDVVGFQEEWSTVRYIELIPVLIKAIQEQQQQIEALQQQIGGLKPENSKDR